MDGITKGKDKKRSSDRKITKINVNFLSFIAVKLGDLQDALQSFEKALELAKILEDDAAENAISKAINDVNDRIAQGEWIAMEMSCLHGTAEQTMHFGTKAGL